jgi:hypothetical protein
MNMKRGLVFSVCALALAAYSGKALAQNTVDVALNLHYTDPNNVAAGGTWTLVAKTGATNGISAVNSYISNINTAGVNFPAALNQLTGGPYVTSVTGGVNVLYGQDTANGPIALNVGRGTGTPSNQANDPFKNAAWNNVAVIATGTFGGSRPAFVSSGANSTDANVFTSNSTTTPLGAGAVVGASAVTTKVRGDSVAADGLKAGDANRDNKVDSADFNLLALNFGGTGKTWDQGDFNDSADGKVDSADFNLLALNFGASRTPPAAGAAGAAVPEPASVGLLALSAFGMLAVRRRS